MNTEQKKISHADRLLLVIGALVLISTVVFRLHLLHLPIDRDEGEFAYAGWRMLRGGIPFLDFYNMKMPGIYVFYALLFSVFGSTVAAIRAGLIFVNLANTFLIYRLTRNFSSTPSGIRGASSDLRTGIFASICYLILSVQVELQGTSTHAEHVAMLFVLSGLLFFTSARFFWSGVLLGIAFIVKQPSASFIILAVLFLSIEKYRNQIQTRDFLKSISLFVSGALLPFLITTILLITAGAEKNFYLFAFQYAKEYVSYLTLQDGISNFNFILSNAITPNLFLWMIVPVGAVVLFFQRANNGVKKLWFFLFSFFAVSAGYYFRPHYFQFLIPASAMLVASALVAGEKFFNQKNGLSAFRFLPLAYLIFGMSFYIYNERSVISKESNEEAIRIIYGQDFFNATKSAGEFIAKHSSENSSVAIFGAEPEIWFYSKRKAASGFLYVYPLLEHQKFAPMMRQQFYDEVKKSQPEILVYTSNEGTWYADNNVHAEMFNWYKQFRDSSFKRIGLINIPYDKPTTYDWSGDTTAPVFEENYIEICKRK